MQWSDEQCDAAITALFRIKETFDAGGRIPHRVYEPWLRVQKKFSTETVVFNQRGEIYLIQRPHSTVDPYSDLWHGPGVTHLPREFEPLAWKRLHESELGGCNLEGPHFVVAIEQEEETRGLYQLRIHIARTTDDLLHEDTQHRFFGADSLPPELVRSHRELIIPIGIAAAKARGWISY